MRPARTGKARHAARRLRRRARRTFEDPNRGYALRGAIVRPYWRFRFHSLGDGAVVYKPGRVAGAHRIAIGREAIIGPGAWLVAQVDAWRRPEPALVIGDRVAIGPYAMVGAGESVTLEDDVGLSAFCTVLDTRHVIDGPFDQIARNPVTTKPVRIGRGSGLGVGVTVLQGSTIGTHCVIGAHSVVRGEIPDYSIAVGSPARVIGHTREADAAALAAS